MFEFEERKAMVKGLTNRGYHCEEVSLGDARGISCKSEHGYYFGGAQIDNVIIQPTAIGMYTHDSNPTVSAVVIFFRGTYKAMTGMLKKARESHA